MLRVIIISFDAIADIDTQNGQPISNRNAGSDDEEVVGKPDVASVFLSIKKMVCNQGRHNNGLAGASSHFKGDPGQIFLDRMSLLKLTENKISGIGFPGDFIEPNRRFDCLPLRK